MKEAEKAVAESSEPGVDQESLALYLARAGRLPVLQGLALAVQLLAALDTLHRSGTAHGNISLVSLRISRTGRLVVPLPSAVSAEVQPRGHRMQDDPAADLFAAAVVVYALLTGSPVGAAGARRSLHASRLELPSELEAVFARALASHANDRYPSAAQFAEALQASLPPPHWDRTLPAPRPTRARMPVQSALGNTLADLAEPQVAHKRYGPPPRAGRFRSLSLALGGAVATCLALALWTGLGPALLSNTHEVHAPAPLRLAQLVQPARKIDRPKGEPVASTTDSKAITQTLLEEPRSSAHAPPGARLAPAIAIARRDRPHAAPDAQETPPAIASVHAREGRLSARRAAGPHQPARPNVETVSHLLLPGPDAACRRDFPMAPDVCTAFRCATSEFRQHPVCVRMHAQADRARARLAEARGGP